MTDRAALLELQQTLYDSRNPTRRWLHNARREWVSGAIARVAASGPRRSALEVGPGSGVYLPLLAGTYDRVTALDVEPEFLVHAEGLRARHPNIEVVTADVTQPGLGAGSFDLVLCSEVIEHLPDSRPALAAIRRLLRPGGTLVLTTPQRHSPLEVLGRVAFRPGVIGIVRRIYREPILPTGHINLLTRREVAAQLAEAGLSVRERDCLGAYVPLLAEAGGRLVVRAERRIERALRGSRAEGLLWTQCWVASA